MTIPFPIDDRHPDRRTVKFYVAENEWLSKEDTTVYYFCFLKSGFAELVVDNNWYFCASPSVLCLNENQTLQKMAEYDLKACTVMFLPEFINRNMTLERIHSQEYPHLCDDHDFLLLRPFVCSDFASSFINGISPDMAGRIAQNLEDCARQIREKPDWYWSCRARSGFLDCLHMVERLYYRENPDSAYTPPDCSVPAQMPELKEALELIWTAYAEAGLTANAVISRLHTNKETLNRQFKAVLNTSVYQYILDYRLSVATKKLRFTSLTMDEIACSSGFGSAANFSTLFKKQRGMSPSEFRHMVVDRRKKEL